MSSTVTHPSNFVATWAARWSSMVITHTPTDLTVIAHTPTDRPTHAEFMYMYDCSSLDWHEVRASIPGAAVLTIRAAVEATSV